MLFGWDGTALAHDGMIVEILKSLRVGNILQFLLNDFEPTRASHHTTLPHICPVLYLEKKLVAFYATSLRKNRSRFTRHLSIGRVLRDIFHSVAFYATQLHSMKF